MLKNEILRILAAFMFFSRIPVPYAKEIRELHFEKAVRYLPLVGFLISIAGAVIMYFTFRIFPKPISVLLGMFITVLLTGAIHEDGLADSCDGFGGAYNKQRILDIMKDSHIGTFGVIGLILSFLLRYATLSEMPRFYMAIFFITGNTLSRLMTVLVMHKNFYVRDLTSSKSKNVIANINWIDLIIATLPVLFLFVFIGSNSVLFVLIPVWLTQKLLKKFFSVKIGGYTGDCLGAVQQITEIIFYLSVLIWLRYIW